MSVDPVRMKKLMKIIGKTRPSETLSLEACTVVKLARVPKDHPLSGKTIYKRAKILAVMGTGLDYEAMVNKRLIKEGEEPTFEGQPLPWGKWVPGLEHLILTNDDNTNAYVRVYPTKTIKETYFDQDDNPITKEEIEPFKPKRSPSRQGLKNEVEPRVYMLENLIRLKACGEEIEF